MKIFTQIQSGNWAIGLILIAMAAQPSAREPSPQEFGHCIQLLQAEKYEEARAEAAAMVERYPESSRAQLLLALGYHKDRRYEAAEGHFKKALELNPNDHVIRTFYGWCLYYLGKPEPARDMFEKFLTVQPDHADSHFAIGLLDYEADQLDAAKAQFEKAIASAQKAKSRGDEAKSRARLADVLVRERKLEEAKAQLERAIELNPNLYGAYFKLSRVLQRLGDAEGAAKARKMHDIIRERVRPTTGQAE